MIWCVCVLNTNIILQLSFFSNDSNMPGPGKPFLVVVVVFYSTEWKVSFIDGHLPLSFDIINRAAVNGLLHSFPLFTLCVVLHETIRLIFISSKSVSPGYPAIQSIWGVSHCSKQVLHFQGM